MLLALLHVGLFLQLGSVLPGSPADAHRQEIALLHRAVSPESLRSLDVWDDRLSEWRRAKPAEIVDEHVPVVLLHFWGSWCKPCQAELPIWREMGPRLEALHKGKVRILYVALQTNNGDMERFLPENKDRMPPEPWFLDVAERIASTVGKALPDARLPLPVTVWLDRQRVVRQVLVGSIHHRRAEVVDSTARLVNLDDELHTPAKSVQPPQVGAPSKR